MNKEKNIFSCSFGVWPFRKTVELYPSALTLNGELFPLREVTGLRWGTDKVRGGIFPKYVYRVGFSAGGKDTSINTRDKDFYSVLMERFCKTLLPYVIKNICGEIKSSGRYSVTGELAVSDDGIFITEKGFTGKRECFYRWEEINTGVEASSLCFVKDGKLAESLSLLWTMNAQVLEAMLSVMRSEACRLSEVCDFI